MKILQALFHGRQNKQPFCSALIAAAGSSERMGGSNKLLLSLGDKPVLAHTLLALEHTEAVREIVIAAREEDLVTYADLCKTYGVTKPVKIIQGGATRTESVYRAALEADRKARLLAVQDGARPLATPELIAATIEAASVHFAAAPAIPVHDTIKVAENGVVRSTPDRATLFAVQTPQVFDAELLRAALRAAQESGAVLTDDCSAIERMGKEVHLTEGSEENLKITTPLDLIVAEAILQKRGT